MATIIDPSISYIINNNLIKYHDLFIKCCHRTAEFPKGAILSRSGEPIPYMYFMLEGMVKVYTMNPSGYIRILGVPQKQHPFCHGRNLRRAGTRRCYY